MANEIDFHPAYAVQPSLAITFGAKGGVPTFVSAANPFPVEVVAGGGGGGGAANDRELVVVAFRVKTAFTGASVGDLVTMAQVLDVDGTPAHVATIWRNQTTGADLGSAPAAANLDFVGSTAALTDAQLRAAAVPVDLSTADKTVQTAIKTATEAMQAAVADTTTASPVKPGDATVRGAQYGLGIDAVTALTIPGSTKFAWVQAEGQNARWRHDGAATAPTASSGARIIKDQPPVLIPVAMLTSARFIGEASGGKLNIIYAS